MLRLLWKNDHKGWPWWAYAILSFLVHVFVWILFFSSWYYSSSLSIVVRRKSLPAAIGVRMYVLPPKQSCPKSSPLKPTASQSKKVASHVQKKENKKSEQKVTQKLCKQPKKELKKEIASAKKSKDEKKKTNKIEEKKIIQETHNLRKENEQKPLGDSHEYTIEQQQALLYEAVVRYWAPPAGIASDCACEVTITIGHDAKARAAQVTQKSGVLMYDLAARKAALNACYPIWFCGKTVMIRFVQ